MFKPIVLYIALLALAGCSIQPSGQSGSSKSTEVFNAVTAEGVVNGGGGKGVRCGNQIRTLDLYETFGSSTISSTDFDSALKHYGARLIAYRSLDPVDVNDPVTLSQVNEELKKQIVERFVDIPSNMRLAPTPDATLPALKEGCEFVQVIVWGDDDRIYRDLELWNQLSPIDQAALVLHEEVYRRDKLSGAKTSDRTRYLIGLMISNRLTSPIFAPVWEATERVDCTVDEGASNKYQFTLVGDFQHGANGSSIHFSKFNDLVPIQRLSDFSASMKPSDLLSPTMNFTRQSYLQGSLYGDLLSYKISHSGGTMTFEDLENGSGPLPITCIRR